MAENQSRPNPKDEAAKLRNHSNISSINEMVYSVGELNALANQLNGVFVCVVKTSSDTYRRRCFLTLAAAENHAHRAVELGQEATVVLCSMEPLYRVTSVQLELGGLP